MVLGGRVRPERAVCTRPAPAEAARQRLLTRSVRRSQALRRVALKAPMRLDHCSKASSRMVAAPTRRCFKPRLAVARSRVDATAKPGITRVRWAAMGDPGGRHSSGPRKLTRLSGFGVAQSKTTVANPLQKGLGLDGHESHTRRESIRIHAVPGGVAGRKLAGADCQASHEDGVSTARGPSTFCTLPLPKAVDRIRGHYSTEASSGSS